MADASNLPKPFYEIHVFCCINERPPDHPRGCCSARGSVDLQGYMKARAKDLGIASIRVNKSGCLDRCELGPTMVIYPEAVWYTYKNHADVDEILERHIVGGKPVERLLLDVDQEAPEPEAGRELRLCVTDIRNLTPDIRMFELGAADGGDLPAFDAGAHIDVTTGSGLMRSYSLANDPAERHRYVLAVLHEPGGDGGSVWMNNDLAVGDDLAALGPLNSFALAEGAGQHILVAGGIGITPILAMGYRLRRLGAPAALHYCTRSLEQTAFAEEVREAFGNGVTFYHDGGDPSKGIQLDAVLGTRPDGAHLYVCGPTGLLEAARRAARDWPEETVHFELFKSPDVPAGRTEESFEIVLAQRSMTLTVPPDKSILEVVRAAGVEVESMCEEGICGTCRTGLLGGRADHRDAVLEVAEKAANEAIMVCCSRALAGETLILDL